MTWFPPTQRSRRQTSHNRVASPNKKYKSPGTAEAPESILFRMDLGLPIVR